VSVTHPLPPLSDAMARELILATGNRIRWYETRGYPTPPLVTETFLWACSILAIDPRDVK
jgi:hypothetical protein